ncbi:MAG: fatty acid desaturase [Bradymonadia bacterium]
MATAAETRSMPKKAPRSKGALTLVPVAWPTLALTAFALLGWLFAFVGVMDHRLSLFISLPLASWCAFAAFTPMHDASHRSVTRKRWPNEVVGRLCSIVLTAPFPAFRHVHLTHHKHTNDPVKDPDFWSGRGPKWLLPLRWLTQDFHYYVVYARAGRPRKELVETVSTLVLIYGLIITLVVAGHGTEVALAWLIPARLAIGFLAFSFDYLPHRPHQITSKEDRYKATTLRPSGWMTPLLMFQNYHLIHHLYPAVPFYRYAKVWRERREQLLAKGAVVKGH